MSSGGNPLYRLVKQDSRNFATIGNAIGWQGLEDEANHNVKNPGRAITKAAINAALWYIGGEAGSALGGGEGAGGAAAASTDAAESGGTLALNAAGTAVTPYATQAAQQAALQAAQQSALQYTGGLDPETLAGQGGMGVSQNGIGPGSLLNQARGAVNNPSSLMSSDGLLGNLVGGSNTGKAGNLAIQMGLKSLAPQQAQGPMQAPPRGQQPQGPLPMPYQNSLTTGQNSLSSSMPPPGMSYAEWIRRKQMGLI